MSEEILIRKSKKDRTNRKDLKGKGTELAKKGGMDAQASPIDDDDGKESQNDTNDPKSDSKDVKVEHHEEDGSNEKSIKKDRKKKKRSADVLTDSKIQSEVVFEDTEEKEELGSGGQEGEQEEEEVVALSHKDKRLAKRRKLAGLPDTTAEENGVSSSLSSSLIGKRSTGTALPSSSSPLVIGNTPSKTAFGIWVGNLNYSTHPRTLIAWFSERGLPQESVTRLNCPTGKKPATEHNRGFAYIDFSTETEQEVAIGLSEQHLDGRKLLIKKSTDYTGRPVGELHGGLPLPSDLDPSSLTTVEGLSTNGGITTQQSLNKTARKILSRQKNQPGPTLFLGNLGFESTVESIKNMFDAHQKASAVWLPKPKVVPATTSTSVAKTSIAEHDEVEDKKKVDEDRNDDDEDDDDDSENDSDDDSGEDNDDLSSEEGDERDELSKVKSRNLAEDGNESDEEKQSEGEHKQEDGARPKRIRTIKAKPEGPRDLSKAKDAGIRKIRLGTFEDTGKCKGWAFVDFHLVEQCTRALLNVRNHTLDGRNLVVEYASPDAVRRGAIGTRAAIGPGRSAGRGGSRGGRGAARGIIESRPNGAKKGKDWDDADTVDSVKRDYTDYTDNISEITPSTPSSHGFSRPDKATRGSVRGGRGGTSSGRGGPIGRAKPGAALATAQRASEAILPSQGRKITFD